jgi:hypothetical protein
MNRLYLGSWSIPQKRDPVTQIKIVVGDGDPSAAGNDD